VKRGIVLCGLAALATLGGGSATASRLATGPKARRLAHWVTYRHVKAPVDLAGPRGDRALVLAAAGRLWLLRPSGTVRPFAAAYQGSAGEPYVGLATDSHKGCSFGRDTVYALRLNSGPGVTSITAHGRVRRFATINAPGLLNGIAFDETGRFGYRLLVTINAGSTTTVDAINCHGAVKTITSDAPRVEGGVAVAPSTFGRYSGDLIAPDELSGRVFGITPRGRSVLVADSGLPHGQDTGVESEAFLPATRRFDALLADRLTAGNPYPGDDVLLRVRSAALFAAGARPGDLLVATEGGARTVAIRCGRTSCQVRHVADGPAVAHAEGHIALLPR
jgi:hypothetical protein